MPVIGEPVPLPPELAGRLSQPSASPVQRPTAEPASGWVAVAQANEIRSALEYMDPDDRQTWVDAGMSIKQAQGDAGFDIWLEWSAKSPKFVDEEDCAYIWNSFKGTASSLRNVGSLYKEARENGWAQTPVTVAPTYVVPMPPGVPLPPAPMATEVVPAAPAAVGRGNVVVTRGQLELFSGYTYVEDINRILSPRGDWLDSSRFDIRFGGREFTTDPDGNNSSSAWACYTQSKLVEFPKVRGMFFDPRVPAGEVTLRDGALCINSYAPLDIRAEPGDVTPFLNHLRILFPKDWHILLSYLKFMIQYKGEKAMWWPFLQGTPGNGKSFISATMEYCIGRKFTQKPTPKNIDSQFNASLYGCLFIALEDVKIKDDHGVLWETLKPMITEPTLEIQPKGVDKVTREICFNGILNSNHKDGIRKEEDDRRLAPFFAAQQRKRDLARDGLTKSYFWDLWTWAKADGWAHVAHYLANDPIIDEYNPATQCKIAPITSSTAEAIALGMGSVEQEIIERVNANAEGFRGGWICGLKLDSMLKEMNRHRTISHAKRADMLESLGYTAVEHRVMLSGGLSTRLYVTENHAALKLNDPVALAALYEKNQRA